MKLSDDLANLFSNLESEYNLKPGLLKAVAKTESGFNPNARSPVGAAGMFQFMPATAKQYGVNVDDPVSSAKGAAKMYSDLLRANNGDLNKALAGYNWGQGNVQKKGLENAPLETRNYISKITGLLGGGSAMPEQKKSKSQQLDANNFPPELWEAYEEMEALKKNGSQASLPKNPNNLGNAMKKAEAINQKSQSNQPSLADFTPEQLEAYQEYEAMQQNQSNPNPQPQAAAQTGDQIGQALYQKVLSFNGNTDKLAEFYSSRSPSEKIFLNKVLEQEGAKNPEAHSGFMSNIWQGVVRASQGVNNSFEQMGAGIKSAVTGDNSLELKNQEIAKQNALREVQDAIDPSLARSGGQLAGEVATAFALPQQKLIQGGASIAGKVLGSRALDTGIKSAAASVIANPTQQGTLAEKATQAGLGGVLGAGAGAVLDKAIPAIAKPFTAKLNPEDEAFIAAAKAKGLNPLASELPSAKLQPGLIKEGQNLARDNDTVRDVVTANQTRAEQLAREVGDDIPKLDKSTYMQAKRLDGVANDTNHQYHYAAKEIEKKLNNLDLNDPNAVLKVTAEANYLSKKVKNKAEYDEAARLAPKDKIINLENSQAVLKTAREELENIATPALKSQFAPIVKNIEEALGNGQMNYVKADQLFKELGVLARQSIKTGDDNAARIYNDLKKAVNADKDAFVDSLPNDVNLQAYKAAYGRAKSNNMKNIQAVKSDNSLRNLMEPFNRNGNANLPDNLISNLVKKGQTEKVRTLFNNLDDEGKNAVQQAVLNKLLNSATTDSAGFSAKAFNKAYKAYSDPANGNTPLNVVFDGQTASKLKDLMGIFDNLNSLGYNKINPQTGVQNMLKLENISKMSGIAAAPFSSGLSLVVPALNSLRKAAKVKALTDPKYNKLLLDIKNTNPSSKKYLEKVTQLLALIVAQQ